VVQRSQRRRGPNALRIAGWHEPAGLYARAHRLHLVIFALISIPLAELLLGSFNLVVPGARSSVTFRSIAPTVVVSLIIGNCQTPLSEWEDAASQTARAVYESYLAATLLVGAATTLASQLILNDHATAVIVARCYLMSAALALVSARLLGWRKGWVLPLASLFPLLEFKLDSTGRDRWWDWSGQPPGAVSCWVLVVASLLTATLAVLLTPHRIAYARPGVRQLLSRSHDR
jgi:hypothetical protein